RTIFLPVHILCTNSDLTASDCIKRSGEIDEWREDRNLIAFVFRNQRAEFANKGGSFVWRLVHLPIGCNELFSHASQLNISELPTLRCRSKTTIDLGATV